jgi:hypothetical protein
MNFSVNGVTRRFARQRGRLAVTARTITNNASGLTIMANSLTASKSESLLSRGSCTTSRFIINLTNVSQVSAVITVVTE